jgi:hypothetical protein
MKSACTQQIAQPEFATSPFLCNFENFVGVANPVSQTFICNGKKN